MPTCPCIEVRPKVPVFGSFRTRGRRMRARVRGTASVEAVIALPVLILLLFGVIYVSNTATGRHRAEGLARTCAWKYAAAGCRTDRMAQDFPECGSVGLGTASASFAPVLSSDLLKEGLAKGVEQGPQGAFQSVVTDFLVRELEQLVLREMQQEAVATVPYQVHRAGLGGPTLDELVARYQLPCNVTPSDPATLAKSFFTKLVH